MTLGYNVVLTVVITNITIFTMIIQLERVIFLKGGLEKVFVKTYD